MKKQSKTTTVYRIDLEKGKYTTISRAILMNPELKDSSKTLLQLILNNAEDWKLNLSYYRKHLRWSNDKLAAAVAELIEQGYLKKEKHSKGKDKGFYYTYIISEFGNLNPEKEQASEEEIITAITDEKNDTPANDVVEPSEPEQATEQTPDTSTGTTQNNWSEADESLWNSVKDALTVELRTVTDTNFVTKVASHYISKIKNKELTPANFSEAQIRKVVGERVAKMRAETMKQIESWLDLHNDRGTKDQRANIRAKALIHFNEQLDNGEQVNESEVRKRLLYLKSSVVDGGRNLDQRYQD